MRNEPWLTAQAEELVVIAVNVYNSTIDRFLPTPSKCHYTFNLRDLSKVVQGMLMTPTDMIEDKEYTVKLFACEMFRVFRDRLINADDRRSFSEICHKEMEEKLQLGWELESFENVIFGDYEDQKKQYIKLSATDVLIPRLEELLMLYNSDN